MYMQVLRFEVVIEIGRGTNSKNIFDFFFPFRSAVTEAVAAENQKFTFFNYKYLHDEGSERKSWGMVA